MRYEDVMKGKFIVFEGIDGCGKSSQSEKLKEYLENKGVKIWLTKEPTDGQTGQLLQRIQAGEFKDYFTNPDDFARFMSYLYAADRVGHDQQIREHLEAGEWVICDRYKYSTYAYNYNEMSYGIVKDKFMCPDLPIFINIPVKEAFNRIDRRGKKREIFEVESFLNGVVEHYNFLEELCHIDGLGTKEEVFERIKNLVDSKLGKFIPLHMASD